MAFYRVYQKGAAFKKPSKRVPSAMSEGTENLKKTGYNENQIKDT